MKANFKKIRDKVNVLSIIRVKVEDGSIGINMMCHG
ncbi:MAG: hypothetical protein JWQ66_1149 [Mucilaginibacter sp.]|nr:hypothetical protein [Mucilaginibacter sp.]